MRTVKIIIKETLQKVIEVEYDENIYNKQEAIEQIDSTYLDGMNPNLKLDYILNYTGNYSLVELIGSGEVDEFITLK